MNDLKRLCMVVGLGNPGRAYMKTRHNVGFLVLDKVACSYSILLNKKKFNTVFGTGSIEERDVILVKPMAFMNLSGAPVYKLARYFNIASKDICVIHDDIDLAFGRIKIKAKGGHGGHNGLRSLTDVFGSGDFGRVRVGIGRGDNFLAGELDVSDHVLGRFNDNEKMDLNQIVKTAGDSVVAIICEGTQKVMNRINRKKTIL